MIIKLYEVFTRNIFGGIKCSNCKTRIHENAITDMDISGKLLGYFIVKVTYCCKKCEFEKTKTIFLKKREVKRYSLEYCVKNYFEYS